MGKCLFRIGRYELASKTFPEGSLAKESSLRASLRKGLQSRLNGRLPVQIERSLRPDLWVALVAKVKPGKTDPEEWTPPSYTRVAMVEFESRGDKVWKLLSSVNLPFPSDFDWWRGINLFRAETGRGSLFVAYASCPSASHDWNAQWLVTQSSRLHLVQRFVGCFGTKFLAPGPGSGLTVRVSATRKIPWMDVYEWNGKRFTFANRRHPELYSIADFFASDDYREAMIGAASFTIHGLRTQSVAAWKTAEHACRMSIWYGQERSSRFWEAGYIGSKTENLKEIRQRIRWLQRGEMNHPLLYRPYDFDLQVPPYKLWHRRNAR